jgi:uncharacterized membrane protein YkoI
MEGDEGESEMKTRYAIAALLVTLGGLACKSTGERASTRPSAIDPRSLNVDAQQALAAAIAVVPGSAQEMRLEARGGKPAYEVTVTPKAGGTPVLVEVDATTGQVTRSESATDADHEVDDDDD